MFIKLKTVDNSPLSVDELRRAERLLILHSQRSSFRDEIQRLETKGSILRSSRLIKLQPYLNDNVLVVGGRLTQSHFAESVKHPIILCAKSRLAYLIANDAHGGAHVGVEWTVALIRQRFWIIGLRPLVKKIKFACVVCKKLYATPPTQLMSSLPVDRVTPNVRCFELCSCDAFGPFLVKVGRSTVKRYGLIFVCLVVRAVHLEVLASLDSQSFVLAFMRFCSRRSFPTKVYSDNGRNFVGALADLRACWDKFDREMVVKSARRVNVDWVWTTPYASSHNGAWERLIRSVRRVLVTKMPVTPSLSDEMLHSIFCQVENILNSRPLSRLSDDACDLSPLTANHFLIYSENPPLSWGLFQDADRLKKGWKNVQLIVNDLWKVLVKTYLHNLQLREKWQKEKANVKVGDLVLLVDILAPRGRWPLGLIEEVFPGPDGLVRTVKVRTSLTTLLRPINKIVSLETVH